MRCELHGETGGINRPRPVDADRRHRRRHPDAHPVQPLPRPADQEPRRQLPLPAATRIHRNRAHRLHRLRRPPEQQRRPHPARRSRRRRALPPGTPGTPGTPAASAWPCPPRGCTAPADAQPAAAVRRHADHRLERPRARLDAGHRAQLGRRLLHDTEEHPPHAGGDHRAGREGGTLRCEYGGRTIKHGPPAGGPGRPASSRPAAD